MDIDYRLAFEMAPVGLCLSRNRRIVDCNALLCEMFAAPREAYTRMAAAIVAAGHPMVFSLCEWGENKPWEWGKEVGQLWRTTGDIEDTWESMYAIAFNQVAMQPYAKPGRWNDPDMLEIGNGTFDAAHPVEARAHLSLWAMVAAPLIIGTDLTKAAPDTIATLDNREVIAVDQASKKPHGCWHRQHHYQPNPRLSLR